MSGVKAKLKVVLQADETVVAESEDSVLWQRVLMAINTGDLGALAPVAKPPENTTIRAPAPPNSGVAEALDPPNGDGGDEELARFAKAIGVSLDEAVGACAPSKESPYLTLDMHCWNALKEQTPPRGPGSISPMSVAATLLALWMREARLGNATQAEAQKVLGTINLRDQNAARSIAGTEWLQGRPGGVVVVNPARIKRAVGIARAFCTQDWKTNTAWKGTSAE